MQNLRIAFGQTNPVVGDFQHNLNQILVACDQVASSADLLVFGELALCGYPLGDLSYRRDIIEGSEKALRKLVSETKRYPGLTIVAGFASLAKGSAQSQSSYAIAHNSAAVIKGGELLGVYHKQLLPNYDVFDDWRNFIPGKDELFFEVAGVKCAVAICEDIWNRDSSRSKSLRESGVELLVVPNGSPYTREKRAERIQAARTFQDGFALAYANLAGGQDELVFDGGSFLLDNAGNLVAQLSDAPSTELATQIIEQDPNQLLWNVLVTGVRDYLAKTRQKSVVLGLSGGIDSALCAAIAAEAIGPENVFGVALPSRYSSEHSLSDAKGVATALGVNYREVSIEAAHKAFESSIALSPLAGENIQARIRAVILMGISNTEGHLLLTTGNKSEIAVGYSTMYGDAAGGFGPIKDLYKTDVWAISRWRNESSGKELIPWSSITKAPSAELRPDQKDQDSLPEYELLDAVLRELIENSRTISEIVQLGFNKAIVSEIDAMVRKAEWKRSQGAIGTKTTKVAFGSGRRVPLTTRFEAL